jgi:hypothetical protein
MNIAFEQLAVTAERNRALTQPSLLHLVNSEEVEALRKALASGIVPTDFEAKLDRLSGRGLLHQFVADNCRSFVRLLLADHPSPFHQATPAERERLLRVLAYVRKENDAIADYKPNGFPRRPAGSARGDLRLRAIASILQGMAPAPPGAGALACLTRPPRCVIDSRALTVGTSARP